jgi:hypothetical protein
MNQLILFLLILFGSDFAIRAELCNANNLPETVKKSKLIIEADLLQADMSDSLVYPETMGSIGFKFVNYSVKNVIKGNFKDKTITVSFILMKNSKWIDKNNPKLASEYFEQSKKYILVLRENPYPQKLLKQIDSNLVIGDQIFLPIDDCWGVIDFDIDSEKKIKDILVKN